jgi:hypothetical protein
LRASFLSLGDRGRDHENALASRRRLVPKSSILNVAGSSSASQLTNFLDAASQICLGKLAKPSACLCVAQRTLRTTKVHKPSLARMERLTVVGICGGDLFCQWALRIGRIPQNYFSYPKSVISHILLQSGKHQNTPSPHDS